MQEDVQAEVRSHAKVVWRFLLHLGVPEDQLEDLSQEVLLTVWRRHSEFRGDSSLRTWIYGICRNVAADARRRAKTRREICVAALPDAIVQPAQEGSLWVRRAHEQLVVALECLDEDQRMVFVLYEIEQLDMQEIAKFTQTPLTTCYSRLTAARSKVLSRLRRSGGAERLSSEGKS